MQIERLESGTNTTGPDAAPAPSIAPASWYALALLCAINFFAYLDRSALSILSEAIKLDLQLSDKQLGLLSGLAFAAFHATLGIPLARLADKSSRVKLMAWCLALWTAMTALCGVARNFIQLFAARVGVGVGEAGCVPAGHSIIADTFPRERRALAISIFQAGAVFGSGAGLFIVGALGQSLGWRAALQIVGLAGIPLALVVYFTMREPKRMLTHDAQSESTWSALSALAKRPALVHLIIAYSLGTICTAGMVQWLPNFLIRSFGMSILQVGAWSGGASIVGGVGGLLTGGFMSTWLAAKDPRWELRIPTIAYALFVPVYIAMVLSPSAWLVVVLKTVAWYVAAIGGGLALAAVQSFAESNRRATAVSLVLFLSSILGMGLGPYLIGVVSDLLAPRLGKESLRYSLLLTCALVVWAAIHFQIASSRSAKDRVN